MARRVNTKFVIILGSSLFLVAGGVLGLRARDAWHNRDSVYLQKMGDEALAKDDLKSAVGWYERAAFAASNSHAQGTDALYLKLGDLAMQLSAKSTNPVDSAKYYGSAQAAWKRALTENASYVPARRRLIEEQYKVSVSDGRLDSWTALEETAKKLTVQDKTYGKGFTYLAAARFALLRGTSTLGLDAKAAKGVEDDIQTAIKEDPDSALPRVLHADLLELEASRLPPGNAKDAKKLLDTAIGELKVFLAKAPNDPEVVVSLAELYWNVKQQDDAIKLLETAIAAHPAEVKVAWMLARCHIERQALDKAEQVLKDLTAAAPEDPEAHMTMARFYQAGRKNKEAIAAWSRVVDHPQGGGGITAQSNIRREVESYYNIAWLYMDTVEEKRKEHKPAEEKDAMDQANAFAAKLRASQSPKAWQDLIEGRLQLLNGNTREAIAALQRADAVFGKANPAAPQWMQAKNILSQAYEMNTEWGNSLRYLDEMLVQFPKSPTVALQKARVLNRVARWQDALYLVSPFADPPADVTVQPELQTAARYIQADAYRGLGMLDKYADVMQKIGGNQSVLATAQQKVASGDMAGALQDMTKALQANPDNKEFLLMSVILNNALDHKDEARALLDQALAKDPKNSRLQVMKAQMVKSTGDPLQDRLLALEAITDDFTRHMSKAQVYGQTNDREKQLEELEAALKALEDGSNPALSKEAIGDVADKVFSLDLAWAEEARMTAESAKQRADASRDADVKAKALKEKADADKNHKKYWDQAELMAQKAERMNLDGCDGKLYRGRLEYAKGGDAKRVGIQTLEQAVAARPTNSLSRTVLGQAYYIDRASNPANVDKALAEFREAIQQKPDNGIALRFAIDILISKATTQSLNEARGYLKEALAFTPRDPQLMQFTDRLAMAPGGNAAESIRQREDVRKAKPDDLENISALGTLYVAVGRPLKAAELFEIILKKYPKNLRLADTIAHLLHEGHKDNDALTMYESFIGDEDPVVRFRATLLFGDMYKSLNRPQQAIATYKGAISKQPPGTDDAQRRLADLYFDTDDMKSAEEMYREIYKNDEHKDVKVLRRMVESIIRQNKFADADVLINQLFASHPEDPDGWILRGFSLLRQQKVQPAIDCFNHVLKRDPENLDALHYRAFAQYTIHGDMEQATNDLLAIRARDDKRVNSRILLAQVYRLTRKFAEAADEYEEVIKLQPDVPSYRVEYAQFLLSVADVLQRLTPDNQDEFARTVRVVKPVERLRTLLRDSSGRFPEQPIWVIMDGNLLTLSGATAEGQQRYLEAFRMSGENPQTASTYLASLLKTKNYEEVISLVNRLAPANPQWGDYYLKRGAAYAALGKVQEAMGDYSQAMTAAGPDLDTYLLVVRQAGTALPVDTVLAFLNEKLNAHPDDVATRIGVAELLLSHGKGSQAVTVLGPLVADKKVPYRSLLLRMTGMAKYDAKDFQGAYDAYSELLKSNPDDLEVLNNFAFLLGEDMHRPKDAMVYAERAVKILRTGNVDISFVNNGNVYDTYGWVKFLAGDVPGAITELRRALQVEPTPITCLHMAKAQEKSKDLFAARKALTQGIELATQSKDPILPQLEAMQKEIGPQ